MITACALAFPDLPDYVPCSAIDLDEGARDSERDQLGLVKPHINGKHRFIVINLLTQLFRKVFCFAGYHQWKQHRLLRQPE